MKVVRKLTLLSEITGYILCRIYLQSYRFTDNSANELYLILDYPTGLVLSMNTVVNAPRVLSYHCHTSIIFIPQTALYEVFWKCFQLPMLLRYLRLYPLELNVPTNLTPHPLLRIAAWFWQIAGAYLTYFFYPLILACTCLCTLHFLGAPPFPNP